MIEISPTQSTRQAPINETAQPSHRHGLYKAKNHVGKRPYTQTWAKVKNAVQIGIGVHMEF